MAMRQKVPIKTMALTPKVSVGMAGLWYEHCRQMPRAYDVEEAHKGWPQNILAYVSQSITNVLRIVSTKLSICASKHAISFR